MHNNENVLDNNVFEYDWICINYTNHVHAALLYQLYTACSKALVNENLIH